MMTISLSSHLSLKGIALLLATVLMSCLTVSTGLGQVSWSGIYDFGVRKGGADSSPNLNDIPNSYLQINVSRFQLFVDGVVSDDIIVSAKISAGAQLTKAPDQLNLELASVTFLNVAGTTLNISAGKILTPFGLFPRRQLSPDNPLIGDPLFFRYQTNISPQAGYLDSAGILLAGSLYGGRLSTMYRGGYYVGIEIFGSLAEELLLYDVAVMNAPLSAPSTTQNLDKELAFHGRLAVRPQIWGEFGFSFSSGSFLERGSVNSVVEPTGRFKQQTLGVDVLLSALYYEIAAEYVLNRFKAPYIIYDFTVNPPYKSGLTGADELVLTSRELLVDVRIDVPFYPGVYLAGRYNVIRFGSITNPFAGSSSFGQSVRWDRNTDVAAVAVGFKPARGVLIKAGHEWIIIDKSPRPSLDWSGLQLSVMF